MVNSPPQGHSIALPWLENQWQRLSQRHLNKRLPHALLLSGLSGVGKSAFARHAAQSFLCSANQVNYCGVCDACHLFQAGTHPDFLQLSPPEGKKVIGIDQVRALIEELALTPQSGLNKVAIIDPADAMNIQAANSLLKTLEEPAAADILLLVSSQPGMLPITVRSRCQGIGLMVESREAAESWLAEQSIADPADCLQLAPEAPITALNLSDRSVQDKHLALLTDLMKMASAEQTINQFIAAYAAWDTLEILTILSKWFSLSIKIKMNCAGDFVKRVEYPQLSQFCQEISLDDLFRIHNKIGELSRYNSASFKTRTVLEGLAADIRLIILD